MKTIVAVIVITLLAGCANRAYQQQVASQPPSYTNGYEEGCGSGYSAAGNPWYHFSKNVQRFGVDSMYAQGWTDGYNVCKGRYDSINQSYGR